MGPEDVRRAVVRSMAAALLLGAVGPDQQGGATLTSGLMKEHQGWQ